jgi:hypothetical protein
MKTRGRPYTGPVKLKNGFYIEVCPKGQKKGVKIWNASKSAMEINATEHAVFKEVIILGEFKDGIPFRDKSVA